MLTYDFENINGESLYEHLYRCLKSDIEKGTLTAGEKLPSKRAFSQHLGVSSITVENAYDQLISEGYVYSLPKRGYYVADISPAVRKPALQEKIQSVPEGETLPVTDLSSNHIPPENFPFTIWKKLLREVLSSDREKLMERSPSSGVRDLREAIAGHLLHFRGMDIDPDQVIVGAGTEYLYSVLVQLLGRDKVYCVENPGYRKISMIYRSLGAACRSCDLDEYGVTRQGLDEARARIVHISPTHHFPTGITMPAGRRYDLLSWANEKDGRYIIEDDYDSEFRLEGRPIPAMQSIDISGRVIYVNTFSMSLSPTIRISYMVLPPALANEFYKKLSFYSCTVSNFEQYTLARFIGEGYFEKHINRMRRFYRDRRAQVMKCIKDSPLSSRCRIIERDSGLHFLVQVDTQTDDDRLAAVFASRGLRFTPVSYYCSRPLERARHKFILNYSGIDMNALPAALETAAGCIAGKHSCPASDLRTII